MSALYFLNYVIYNWYKKRDRDPLIYAVVAPATLIYFNLWSVIYWASIGFKFTPPFTKVNILFGMITIIIGNYFFVYHKYRYKDLFANFDNQIIKKSIYKKYVLAYIIITIVLFLSTLISADIRFDGHL